MARPDTPSTIIPSFRYRDALAAIDWLCRAFGFERQAVYEDGQGGVAHAQLTRGGGMIMLGTARDDARSSRMVLPSQLDGRQTHGCSVIVEDADAVYASAKAAGAEIVDDIADLDYGGRGFSCRDPEGYVWWLGSYDPWADH